jgi:hypothetical protein
MNSMSEELATVFGVLWVTVPILALYASVMGYKRKIVVYESRADLNLTCLSLISLVLTLIAFGAEVPVLGWPLLILSLLLLAIAVRHAFRANTGARRGFLSVIAKYALLGLVVLLALLAIASAVAALQDMKNKRYKGAVGSAALSASGAFGFISIRRLINQLVAEQSETRN